MNETAPLLRRADEEAYDEEGFEDEWSMSPKIRYSLYTLGGVLSLVVLWFFVVFLPGQFIPKTQELESLVKIHSLDIELVPLKVGQTLDDKFVGSFDDEPQTTTLKHKPQQVERLIMIGDIHGHYTEFRKLLKKLRFNPRRDRLLVLGDFITKGPDSFKVLDYLVEKDIDCILGNHELYVLRYYSSFHRLTFPEFINYSQPISDTQLGIKGFNDDPEFLLAKKLQPEHVRYINKCSIFKKLGPVPVYKKRLADELLHGVSSVKTVEGIAVHGGMRWDLTLEQQNPIENLEMRSLVGPYYNESTDDPAQEGAVSWSKIWNMKMKEKSLKRTTSIYYGHDARRGLSVKKFSKGLDTGCDAGRQLLAMVIWNEESANGITHHEKLVQVDC